MNEILVPTGPADLVDQIIMTQHLAQTAATVNRRRRLAQRLNLMQRVAARTLPEDPQFEQLRTSVVSARQDLMQLEADLRACDARAEYDVAFVALTQAYLETLATLEAHKTALDHHAERTLLRESPPSASL